VLLVLPPLDVAVASEVADVELRSLAPVSLELSSDAVLSSLETSPSDTVLLVAVVAVVALPLVDALEVAVPLVEGVLVVFAEVWLPPLLVPDPLVVLSDV
jgi:hypothetical protein